MLDFMKRSVYFDNAATTPIRAEIKKTIHQYLNTFGNPSSKHQKGLLAREFIEQVRNSLMAYVGAQETDNLIFTGGGSESNNIAIKGFLLHRIPGDTHIITSEIEHPSVLETFKHFETLGYDVSYIPVDQDGIIKVEELKKSIKQNTALISIIFANNETGSIQPIGQIGKIAKENNLVFHTDAVQAFGKIPIDLYELNIDMLSFSGHKIHAPKGIGGLVYKSGFNLTPLIHGGGQENGLRAGTENTLGIIALGKALQLMKRNFTREHQHLINLKQTIIKKLQETIPDITINGDPAKTLPNILNVSFLGVEAETILVSLDMEGICVSKGSACSSDRIVPSYVLTAMGIPAKQALGSIRFSFSAYNKMSDVNYLMARLPGIVAKARKISAIY